MTVVDLELLIRAPSRWRALRCVLRGHVWRVLLPAGLLVLQCRRCARMLAAELPAPRSDLPCVDVTRDALELAATVLAAGPQDEYQASLDALVRTPRDSLQVLARLLLALSGEHALTDVRQMALMHGLRDVEAAQ